MLFNSFEFIIFLVTVVIVYYLIPNNKIRKFFLLVSSYYFYASWNVTFLAILLFETLLSYGVVFRFGNVERHKKDKLVITVAIIMLLVPLASYKYLVFFFSMVGDLVSLCGWSINVPEFKLLLPIGISFYTFMSIGYVVDVYKHKIQVEKNILDYALFIGFFPQLASGPIGRAPQMLPQFKEKHPLLYENIATGTKLMLWGFFMKLVVGDRAGIYVDTVFGNYSHHNGASLMLATFMYTIQIYCDFAGYSLIAIGAAKTMGFDLMNNFRRPYFATSIADFWRRWHISLSTWFRDYIYFPLGGSRCAKWKIYRNLFITFIVSGLWHGAAYNFILWGGYHAAIQIIERIFNRPKEVCGIRRVIDISLTFVLAAYGWMIFYAPDMQFIVDVTKGYFNIGVPYIHPTTLIFFLIGLLLLFAKDYLDEFFPNKHLLLSSNRIWVKYVSFVALATLIVLFGVLGGGQFIYFKF